MKLKGINPFEQHVEKIVLGGVGAVLLGVVAVQFLTQPNVVTVGKTQGIAPERAFDPVKTAAEDLQAKVRATTVPLPEEPKTQLLAEFERKSKGGVAPNPRIAQLGPSVNLGGAVEAAPGATQSGQFGMAALPAPTQPVAMSFASTIDPVEIAQNPDLKPLVPAEQPFDKRAVTVEARFDGTALKAALAADPDGPDGPLTPLPLNWWKDSVEVLGVQLERETLNPSAGQVASASSTGAPADEWISSTVVPAMPGRPDLVGEFGKRVKSLSDVQAMLSYARERGADVLRPAYYPTIAGPAWVEPTVAATKDETGNKLSPTQVLDRKIDDVKRRLRAMDQAGRSRDREAQSSRNQSGGSGGGRVGKGGGGAAAPQPGNESGRSDEARRRQQEKRRAELNDELTKLEEQRANISNPSASPGAGPQSASGPLLENSGVTVWQHDLTAEAGATYRYRVRLVLNNPTFARRSGADASAQGGDAPVAYTEWSAWTDPVHVDASEYYFVTSASMANELTGVRAVAELYHFYYGYWRKGTVTLDPGDVLAADARLPADLVIFDMQKLAAGERPRPSQFTMPSQDRETTEGGGGKGAGGKTPSTVAEPTPPPANQPASDERPKIDPTGLTKPGPEKIDIETEVVFLDAASVPAERDKLAGGSKQSIAAYLRTEGGRVVLRLPESDRATAVYKRVSESAAAGQNQGKPKPAPEPKEAPPARPEREERPSPGGGGGGGGGGSGG